MSKTVPLTEGERCEKNVKRGKIFREEKKKILPGVGEGKTS